MPGEEPQFGKDPIVDEDSILPKTIDFSGKRIPRHGEALTHER